MRRILVVVGICIGLVGGVACGSSGDMKEYCQLSAKLSSQEVPDVDPNSVEKTAQAIRKYFSDIDGDLSRLVELAPEEIKADTRIVVAWARGVAKTGSFTPERKVEQAAQRVNAYNKDKCPAKNGGSE
jgi:hypothetical protein